MRSPFALSLRHLLAALLLACSLSTARDAAAAWPNDVTQGVTIGGWSGSANDKVVICPDNQGGFWAGSISTYFSLGYYEIRHVSATGATLAVIFSPASGYSKSELQLVPDGSNGVIAVWAENGNILSRRYNSTGGLPWGAAPVSLCSHAATQNSPTAALDSSGNILVFWADYRSGDADIYMQAINISSGAALVVTNGVAVVAVAGSAQYSPRACSDGNLGAYLVWQDMRNSATTGIDLYATRVDYSGSLYWAAAPLGNVAGNPSNARLIGNPTSLQVVWEEDRGAGTGSDIYFQRIPTSTASAQFGTGLLVCNAAAAQNRPAIIADGQGGAIIVWDDAQPVLRPARTSTRNASAREASRSGRPTGSRSARRRTPRPMRRSFRIRRAAWSFRGRTTAPGTPTSTRVACSRPARSPGPRTACRSVSETCHRASPLCSPTAAVGPSSHSVTIARSSLRATGAFSPSTSTASA
jgi:hypothetical protein